MTTVENKDQEIEMTTEEWLAIRKEAGLKIDPETAEVCWRYARVGDPYGVFPGLRKNPTALGESTSLALREVTFGSSSATFLRQRWLPCGRDAMSMTIYLSSSEQPLRRAFKLIARPLARGRYTQPPTNIAAPR
jgi:hypothetical protein